MSTDAQPPWTAEREVTADLARALIAGQFPELAAATVAPDGDGWDNAAFLVGGSPGAPGKWIFRFPRREIAVPLLETECAVLPLLAPRLPLAIPVPERLGRPTERFPWPFAGYRRIEGVTACRAALDEEARGNAAPALARFLAALHACPASELPALGPDGFRRLDLAYRVGRVRAQLEQAHRAGLIDDPGAWDAVFEALPGGWTPGDATVVHGDLYARHVLVDPAGAPCGVIDWGDVHRGDPAVDLSIAHGFLPRAAHDAFRDAYRAAGGTLDDAAWSVARLRALSSAAATLVYAGDVADRALLRESLTALRHLAG